MTNEEFKLHYDPRNPPEDALVRTDSKHRSHAKLRRTLVLLKLGEVHFVIRSMDEWPCDREELRSRAEYVYDEGICPSTFADGFDAIVQHGDFDPHGVFEFVDVVWMTCDYAAYQRNDSSLADYLQAVFPQLREEKE